MQDDQSKDIRDLELPSELGFPERCPECGGGWREYGINEPLTAYVMCNEWHQYHRELTPEQMMTFQLAVEPEMLTARPLWIVGENRPLSDDPPMRIEADDAVVGHSLRIEGVAYVVDGVEVDRVWIRPTP